MSTLLTKVAEKAPPLPVNYGITRQNDSDHIRFRVAQGEIVARAQTLIAANVEQLPSRSWVTWLEN